jgi:hypothetical protein
LPSKINPGKIEKSRSRINAGGENLSLPLSLSFSFRFLQEKHDKFNFSGKNTDYFMNFFMRLKELSTWDRKRFCNERSNSWRIHQHEWSNAGVSENTYGTGINGARNDEHDEASYQFQLSANLHGRIHGFLIGEVFYIVWFDPEHKLYSR